MAKAVLSLPLTLKILFLILRVFVRLLPVLLSNLKPSFVLLEPVLFKVLFQILALSIFAEFV